MTELLEGLGWSAHVDGRHMALRLSGDWTVRNDIVAALSAPPGLALAQIDVIDFDSSALGHWDSSLLVFLAALRNASREHHVAFNHAGLPLAACRLLDLLGTEPVAPIGPPPGSGLIERLGAWVTARWMDSVAITRLVGETTLRMPPGILGKTRSRAIDFLDFVHSAGSGALPMVALVNVLVGGIIAFVGALELRRLGAEVYISNLVGATVVREMAALITAIVMSGRTGSAYAAEIATMQGSGEIDALRALGIPIYDYLVLPRVVALTAMMPLLALYAGAVGILGGFLVAVNLMSVSAGAFVDHLRGAVAARDILLGLAKSIAFGAWIALVSCRIGLRAGRSAADVGDAATRAAVSGIVGVIVLDALLDVCANALGI
jgi:phospholipid/cholesterol/gamma-HCH transport system permease protein